MKTEIHKRLLANIDDAYVSSDYRRALAGAAEVAAWIDNNLPLLVAGAREDGASWQEVGDTLGISRQAAQQRFGHFAQR